MKKRLQFRERIKQKLRPLAFAALGVACALSCAPKKMVVKSPLVEYKEKIQEEKISEEVKTNDKFRFILTENHLTIVPRESGNSKNNMSQELFWTRKDIRKIRALGIVAWAPGIDRCFLLTKNGEIRDIKVIQSEETIPVHKIPHEIINAKMIFHSGFLFIAPVNGLMIMMKITDKAEYLEEDIPKINGGFFIKNKKLHFGKEGKSVEIKVKGTDLSNITIDPN